jgi:hypothetical protein
MKRIFARKGYVTAEDQLTSELQENLDAIKVLMQLFNEEVLPGIRDAANQAYGAQVVHLVDVRAHLSGSLPTTLTRTTGATSSTPQATAS